MAYTPLYQKYFTLYHRKVDGIRKDENARFKCYLRALCEYALVVNSSFDSMCVHWNYVGAIHSLRMLIDACFNCYGLYIYKDKQAFLNKFYKGGEMNQLTFNGKAFTTNAIKPYIDEEYPTLSQFYKEASRYIHFTNFYCIGVELGLDDATMKDIMDSQDEHLVGSFADLERWKNKKWVYKVMGIINEILLEIMDKVVKMVEPDIIPEGIERIDLNKMLYPKKEEDESQFILCTSPTQLQESSWAG